MSTRAARLGGRAGLALATLGLVSLAVSAAPVQAGPVQAGPVQAGPVQAGPVQAGQPVAAAASAPLAAPSGSSPNRPTGSGQPQPGVSLVSQTQWVHPAQDVFTVKVGTSNLTQPTGFYQLDMVVYPALRFRSALAPTEAGRLGSSTLLIRSYPMTQLPPDGLCVAVGRSSPTCPGEVLQLSSAGGVYPVQISLRGPRGAALDSFVTYLISVPADGQLTKLALAWVQPIYARVATQPDASIRLTSSQLADLDSVLRGLQQRANLPITLQPDPGTVVALEATGSPGSRQVLSDLRQLAGVMPTVSSTYAPVAPSDLVDAGLGVDLGSQAAAGSQVLTSILRAHPSEAPAVIDGQLDRPTLAALASLGRTQLVASASDLSVSSNVTVANPVNIDSGSPGGPMVVVEQDAGLAKDFATRNPALAAQQLIADLTEIYFDNPGEQRGVVVVVPRSWTPDAAMIADMAQALSTSPLVSTVPLSRIFSLSPFPARAQLSAPNGGHAIASSVAGSIRQLQAHLASFTGVFVGVPHPNGIDSMALTSMTSLLWDAEQVGLSSRQREGYLSALQTSFQRELGQISLPQTSRPITLTSAHAKIPVTVSSRLAVPVTVLLRLQSRDSLAKLGAPRTLVLAHANNQVSLPVDVRSAGPFDVQVQVLTPDGDLLIASDTFHLRSTAVFGVGIALSAGALAFLALWWTRSLLRGRRKRNPRLVSE